MQPARADVVWNFTLPASAATAGERHVVMRSFPWCPPCPRAAPKSSKYVALPTTGKISCGTFGDAAPGADAVASPAVRTRTTGMRRRRIGVRFRDSGRGAFIRVPRLNEDCRLRQTSAGRYEAHRPRNHAAGPLRGGNLERVRRPCR